jgi:hypothetical protein
MTISQLIKELQRMKKLYGDMNVTCTASTLPDNHGPIPDVYESTVENLIVRSDGASGYRIRLYP